MTPPAGTAPLGRRLASNTLQAASGRIVALVAWLLLTPPLLRALGSAEFGLWSLFFALTGYLGALDLGLSQATLRFVAAARARGDHAEAGEMATLAALGYVLLGLAWLLIIVTARDPLLAYLRLPLELRPTAAFAFTVGAAVFAFAGLTNVTVAVLQAYDRFDLGNRVALTLSLAQVAGILFSLGRGAGLRGVVLATGAGWALAFLVGLVLIRTGAPPFRWGAPARAMRHVRKTVGFGGPMQIANVLGVAHQQLDKLLLSRYVSIVAVTPYELGLRVATAASTFPQLLLVAIIPAASELHTFDERERLRELHARANRYVLSVAAIVTAALIGGATPLFAAWLGPSSAAAPLALQGLAVAAYFAVAGGVGAAIARGAGRTDLEAEFAGVALVLHLALGLVLVPRFGLIGALVAVTAGNIAGMLWFFARLAAALGWARLPLLLEPFGVPLVAAALGAAAGLLLVARAPGMLVAAPWPAAAAAAGGAALIACAVTLLTRYVSWREAAALLRSAGHLP